MKKVFWVTLIVLLLDQISKFYIKLNFEYGESVELLSWFHLHFIENPGMAYGLQFGGETGKLVLSLLRIGFIIAIGVVLYNWSKKYRSNFLLIPAGMIFAGAIGNVLDGAFYGLIFDKGTHFNVDAGRYENYMWEGLAKANFEGYTGVLRGSVVDMLYFPLFEVDLPEWVPFYGGTHFSFFDPVFNIADAAISVGLAILLLFRNKAFNPNLQRKFNR